MERIKEALEKARDRREQGSIGTQTLSRSGALSGSRLGKDRILEREPFRHYSSAEQQKLLETGRVLNVALGETLQFAGDKDAYVHYLLSGAVVVESDHEAKTVAANEEAAWLPLDRAGVKSHSITAESDAEVFRVPYAALPGNEGGDEAGPIPTAAYTETYSGQQLANLVEQINTEHEALDTISAAPGLADTQALLGEDGSVSALGELSASADSLLSDLESAYDEEIPDGGDPGFEPRVDDEIGRFTHDLELRFRRYVEKVKSEERARYNTQIQKHAQHLQQLAEQEIRTRLSTLRKRYQSAYAEKERRLRARYDNLRDFANKIARQKAAIYVARRQIGEKLRLVEQIHVELSQLGSQLNHQLDDLDDLMPDPSARSSTGTEPN